MKKKYYNKYWENNIEGGTLNLPPSWSEDNLRWHSKFFKRYVGKNVLDFGCGDGTFLNHITIDKKDIKQAVGLDLSEEAIQIGKRKYSQITFRQGELLDLSLRPNTFDTVFAIEVMEHLLDVDQYLEEIKKILKKGGYLCITTTDFNLLKKLVIAGLFWEKFFYPNNPHIRFYTRKTLADICRKHGLEQVGYKWNKSYAGLMPKGQMSVFKKVK